ncbi:MAG TPA: hypothetical protein VEC09_07380, partial [Actinomycetota bacterium]|nr:hypothetical protein [Actinomycetota bacterium]
MSAAMAGAARLVRGALRVPRASDLLVALAVAAIVTTAAIGSVRTPDARRVDALTVVILAAQVVPVLWRQRWPIATLAISWSSVLAYLLLDHPPFTTLFAGAIAATYAATAYGSSGLRVAAGLTSVVGVSLAFLIASTLGPEPNVPEVLITGLVFAVAWIAGDLAKTRHAHVRALEERAERLEREREQEARAAAAAERTRIARELHDVVA